jgi:hypothetical protein
MRWLSAAVSAFLAVLIAAPAHASDEQPGSHAPFSVNFGLGSHVNDGGNMQSLSLGYTGWRDVTLLVNVERDHVPTQVRTYPGGSAETRGGTVTSVSGEVQYAVPLAGRVSPFFLAGLGAGISRPNVTGNFADRVTNVARLGYAGGGVRVTLRPQLDLFVDGRFMLFAERDVLGARVPIRAGVTWRF